MSTTFLNPVFAAELASNVYLIKDKFSRKGFNVKYKNTFDLDESKMVQGKTGALVVVKKSHVMAFMAVGQGDYKGQAFVAIKGTASLYDALTDLNTGVHSSHTGFSVHQGFYYAFDSIVNELRTFLLGLKEITTIHCVGHSLGGAIATLAADWIKSAKVVPKVALYTFGSPRVGLDSFASHLTAKIQPDNIFRVHHKTDPVPLVPTWPFCHVPNSDRDYLVFSPLAGKPWEYHLMKHYIDSAKKAGSWATMQRGRPIGHMDAAIEKWLKSDGIVSFSQNSLELVNAALMYVLKKVVNLTGIIVVSGFATTFTLLDRLAMFIAKAAKLTADVSIWVFHLIKKMAAIIGIKIKQGVDLTTEFVRTVFLRLHKKIADMIWRIGKELE
ncbi:lipase (class 3) [Alteromonadaceae bacterium 2753L.S.0a.02]|nr:lipase (class 3) [Alteromonadaceae bacterium 2753L.S.0a.02]